mgnify:CR=1 FL=1
MKRRNDEEVDYTPQGSDPLNMTPNSDPCSTQLSYRSTEETDLENNIKTSLRAFEEIEGAAEKSTLSLFYRYLYKVDDVDKHYSRILQGHKSLAADVMLSLWAHLFNRGQIVITILLSLAVGSFTYN